MMDSPGASFYPPQLAIAVRRRWNEAGRDPRLLPPSPTLDALLDTMYQASLLREEGEPVRCRVAIGSPEDFLPEDSARRDGLATLRFRNPCAFTAHELRKLSAASRYYRSMLGVEIVDGGAARIWGMVVTGTRWLNRIQEGRLQGAPIPPNLVMQVVGPGHLVVASGYERALETSGGEILSEGFDPFRSEWLPERFHPERSSLLDESAGPLPAEENGTRICDSFVKSAGQNVIRRTLSLVRSRGHGGTLIYLAAGAAREAHTCGMFRFRVAFHEDDATLRFRRLMSVLLRRLLAIGRERKIPEITWEHFQEIVDPQLADLDEALIEFAHFLADLMAVDGALVLDRQFRVIGFGAEILGELHVSHIHRALDLEAARTLIEPADAGGTRHRSAYRLVSGLPDAIAMIVSQDGAVRFVAQRNEKLIYWPYAP